MSFNTHFGYKVSIQMVIYNFFDRAQGPEIIHYRLSVPFHPNVYIAALSQRRIRIATGSTLPFKQATSETIRKEFRVKRANSLYLDLVPL